MNTKFSSTESLVPLDEDEIQNEEEQEEAGNDDRNIDNNNEDGDEEAPVMNKRKNKLWSDNAKNTNKTNDSIKDSFENPNIFKTHKIKRIMLKIWGFYHEKFKQAWERYTTDCEDIGSLYFSLAIFIEIICKYISRKQSKVFF